MDQSHSPGLTSSYVQQEISISRAAGAEEKVMPDTSRFYVWYHLVTVQRGSMIVIILFSFFSSSYK